jgi:hypothetical protein
VPPPSRPSTFSPAPSQPSKKSGYVFEAAHAELVELGAEREPSALLDDETRHAPAPWVSVFA